MINGVIKLDSRYSSLYSIQKGNKGKLNHNYTLIYDIKIIQIYECLKSYSYKSYSIVN